ncbi:MAG: hypothetical protein IPK75_18260 [Acidobacteria bacterium]|nr:hypothetical protein [Acidobacteriota bacterium]
MILGFKDRFIPYVLDGSKTHTIRAGERWRADMRADLFAKVRQKGMRLLFRAPVVRVEEILIQVLPHYGPMIVIGDCALTNEEADMFAWRDGFRHPMASKPHGAFSLMMRFWQFTHKIDAKPFHGQIVHWDYAQRYVPCGDCGRSHPLGPCNAMFRSDWRLPRPTRAAMAAR